MEMPLFWTKRALCKSYRKRKNYHERRKPSFSTTQWKHGPFATVFYRNVKNITSILWKTIREIWPLSLSLCFFFQPAKFVCETFVKDVYSLGVCLDSERWSILRRKTFLLCASQFCFQLYEGERERCGGWDMCLCQEYLTLWSCCLLGEIRNCVLEECVGVWRTKCGSIEGMTETAECCSVRMMLC